MITIKGTIVTPEQAKQGKLTLEGNVIQSIDAAAKEGEVHDYGDALIVPGFIDVHMHGMGGYLGVSQEDIVAIAHKELEFGTTGFCRRRGASRFKNLSISGWR